MEKTQLFVIHFAGGNCNSFHYLKPYLTEFDITFVELPGRGLRMKEKLITAFDEAVEDVYNQIRKKQTARSFLIYGHSMGSYLALRVTYRLENEGLTPAALIVSGNAGPGIVPDDGKIRYLMNRNDLKEELRSMGGISKEFLDHDELFDFFEPILRADFQIVEQHTLMNEPVVSTPLIALMGAEEKNYEKIANWGKYTKSNFSCKILPGGHFFMFHDPAPLVSAIKSVHVGYEVYEFKTGSSQTVVY